MPELETLPASSRKLALGTYHRKASGVTFVERLDEYTPKRRNGKEVMTSAKRNGVRYERFVHWYCSCFLGYQRGPWLLFNDDHGSQRVCQPDGLFILSELIVIVEIKTNHCLDAYTQLTELYYPVVRFAYPEHPIVRLEICQTFSPTIKWPEPIALPRKLDDVFALRDGCAALQWRRGDY